MISREEVVRLLDYDEFTGIFTWKTRPNRRIKVGSEAGTVKVDRNGKSYRYVQVNGRKYYCHRLAWLILTGEFPEDQIDHIDGNGLSNASSNLRAVSNAENGKNQRKPVTNTSGVIGVHWYKPYAKWMAYIKLNGRRKHLGYFDDFADAVAVRKKAERTRGFHPNHGSDRNL